MFVPKKPLESLTHQEIMVVCLIRMAPRMKIAYCLTGDHFGVTFLREPRCPICG